MRALLDAIKIDALIGLRDRAHANTLRGKCPLPMHGSEKSKESFTATLSKGVGARGHASRSRALNPVAASAGTSSISSPRWNSVPSATLRSNCNCGFWSRPAGEPIGKEPHAQISADKEPEPQMVLERNNGAGESESNKPLTFTLQNVDYTHPYLKDRGLTAETAKSGVCREGNRRI